MIQLFFYLIYTYFFSFAQVEFTEIIHINVRFDVENAKIIPLLYRIIIEIIFTPFVFQSTPFGKLRIDGIIQITLFKTILKMIA